MFFSVRSLILTIVTVALLTVLYQAHLGTLNVYARAYDSRIGFYSEKLDSLMRISSWNTRMLMRHVANAHIPQWIAANRRVTDTILLPPPEYANRYISVQASWTDPRIFTYMAGFTPVVAWNDTARRGMANAYIALEPQAITITRPGGSINIDSLLHEYQAAVQHGSVTTQPQAAP